jgi:hypothetical protein
MRRQPGILVRLLDQVFSAAKAEEAEQYGSAGEGFNDTISRIPGR